MTEKISDLEKILRGIELTDNILAVTTRINSVVESTNYIDTDYYHSSKVKLFKERKLIAIEHLKSLNNNTDDFQEKLYFKTLVKIFDEKIKELLQDS